MVEGGNKEFINFEEPRMEGEEYEDKDEQEEYGGGGGEDEEEEAGEEDEEDYTFRFKDGENPLSFVEDNALSDQPYKKFEHLEYEALAEKKRKALAHSQCTQGPAKKARVEDTSGVNVDELMKAMYYGGRRKSRELKKRGRHKGSKNKLNREVSKLLGEATLSYAHGRYKEAIPILHKVVLQAPDLPDPYHTLALVHKELGDNKIAFSFYMLAAHLMPRDSSIWKLLFEWSREQGAIGQANYCLSKAITADPKDVNLRLHRASLYIELGDLQKAAESYDQIRQLSPENVEALKIGAKLYRKCGQLERSVSMLEDYFNNHPTEADLSVIHLLVVTLMEVNEHSKAVHRIEHARQFYCPGKELPLILTIKAGICHAHLGNMQEPQKLFDVLEPDIAYHHFSLITEVADSLMNLGHYNLALKYNLMLEGSSNVDNGYLRVKIANCYLSLDGKSEAIKFFHKALQTIPDDIDTRLTLASILLGESKDDEAICLLSPPSNTDYIDPDSGKSKPWWLNEKVILKLCEIYRAKGLIEKFADVIFPLIQNSYYCKPAKRKVKGKKKRLTKRELLERVKVLDNCETDDLFCGFRPFAPNVDLLKASRAKRLLQKKEEQKAKALAAGEFWQSDDSDDEPPPQFKGEALLPNLLQDEGNHQLIIDLCKALASLQRFSDALETISLTLRAASNMSAEKMEELRVLGAQLAYNTTEPKLGFGYVKDIVKLNPYSIAAWNCYYKVISRLDSRYTRPYKFIGRRIGKLKDCVPPLLIYGHQFTAVSHHQDAARKYLEAYKILPENPLINLCVGTALINISFDIRLQNKHQCLAQGFAFLYNNLRLSEKSQEALYNIARAYHQVGLVTLAASYYEKVLAVHQKDCPLPKFPAENQIEEQQKTPGYCDLRREAAYNLHLIYKKSGAIDLARQVLMDYCSF